MHVPLSIDSYVFFLSTSSPSSLESVNYFPDITLTISYCNLRFLVTGFEDAMVGVWELPQGKRVGWPFILSSFFDSINSWYRYRVPHIPCPNRSYDLYHLTEQGLRDTLKLIVWGR